MESSFCWCFILVCCFIIIINIQESCQAKENPEAKVKNVRVSVCPTVILKVQYVCKFIKLHFSLGV